MVKTNPSNFEHFQDPDGGLWIRCKGQTKFRDVVWRPANLQLDENNQVTFDCEFLSPQPEDIDGFAKVANGVIRTVLEAEMARDIAENELKEEANKNHAKDQLIGFDEPKIIT